MADGSSIPEQRMHTAPHHRTQDLCTNSSRDIAQGTDPVPRENVFARFRSESTQEKNDSSMDTPLTFKMRFGRIWIFSYNCNNHRHLTEAAQPLEQAKFPWSSSPVPGGQLDFSGMDALQKQLAKPKC